MYGGIRLAEPVGFEPTVGSTPTQLFESCTFGRSDTVPERSLVQPHGAGEQPLSDGHVAEREPSILRRYDAQMAAVSLRTPWLQRRRRQWDARAALPGELVYAALGDSAAQGIGARSLDTSYVGRLAERLERHSGRSVRVVNLAQYGARVDDALKRQLPRALALGRVDLMTVAIGANDVRVSEHEGFLAHFDTLLARLPAHAIVADLPCFHLGEHEFDARHASQIMADSIRGAGLAFAPLHRVTELRRGWSSFPEFTWDQFHPSDLGYRVWESAFAGAVTRRARVLRAS